MADKRLVVSRKAGFAAGSVRQLRRETNGRRYAARVVVSSDERMKRLQRQLVLNKGAEKYIFRYEQGRENDLLDALIAQVKDRRTDFDWFDAAVISYKLSQMLIGRAEGLLQKDSDIRLAQ